MEVAFSQYSSSHRRRSFRKPHRSSPDDEVSSRCSSSSSCFASRRPAAMIVPLRERFSGIPEPIRSEMVEASMGVMRRHLKRAADGVRSLLADEERVGPARIESTMRCVEAAKLVGLKAEDLWDGVELWIEEEKEKRDLKRRRRRHRYWSCDDQFESKEEEEELEAGRELDEILEIYD